MSKSFKEFYQSFDLKDYPFNTFTTEHEVDIAKKIFVSQGEYDPIIDAFKSGRNLIIKGERGSGKTAILEDFKRYLSDNNQQITTIFDFSSLPSTPKSTDIYRLIITNFLVDLFIKIGEKPLKLLHLNKEEKILLSYLLSQFLSPISQELLKEEISKIQFTPMDKISKLGI